MPHPTIQRELCESFRENRDKKIEFLLSQEAYDKQKQDAIAGVKAQYHSLTGLFETTKEKDPDAFLTNDCASGGSVFWEDFLVSYYRDHFGIEVSCVGYEVNEEGDELPHMEPDL